MTRFIFFLCMFFYSVCSYSQVNSKINWSGEYRFEEEGEILNDGSQVSISTNIHISDDNRSAVVKITTWHALIACDGPYDVTERNGVLALNYVGEKDNCSYPAPQYEMKRVRGVAYIKSDMITYKSAEWVRLSSSKAPR